MSANAMASRVGAEVLRSGGNAVDAAIATGFALAVVHPTAGNIGGGGFMVIRFPDGRTTTLDFREKAPLAAHPEMFLDENGEYSPGIHHNSHLAVGVPGTVAGFALAHEKYGSGDWARLVDPAVAVGRGRLRALRVPGRFHGPDSPLHGGLSGQHGQILQGRVSPTRRASSGGSPTWPGPWSGSGTRDGTASSSGRRHASSPRRWSGAGG